MESHICHDAGDRSHVQRPSGFDEDDCDWGQSRWFHSTPDRSCFKISPNVYIMGRKYRKSNLPMKICPVCQRPFAWRKKWENCWDEVKCCSERCRRRR
ncbi:DUF2256 domain-containing protein [Baaleninema sp.]|uniref:DUF2256 domain-containing protein n=1 Tax=Baaleninema sp. TaxID=3101197 RepID=UPI003CFDDC41